MASYKAIMNPFTGNLTLIRADSAFHLKDSVPTYNDLPITGNTENDVRITEDDDAMYTWGIPASSGILTDWKAIGSSASIDWSAIDNKPTSAVEDIDDAVDKRHTQGTDQTLDSGGGNEVSASQAKAGYTHSGVTSGNPHSVTADEAGAYSEAEADALLSEKLGNFSADDAVKLLISFDGEDGATTSPDQSNSAHALTFKGTTALDSSQSKFGNASVYFSGATANFVQIDNLSTDFDLEDGDWTMDAQCMTEGTIPNDSYYAIFAKWEAIDSQRSWMLWLHKTAGGDTQIAFSYSTSGGASSHDYTTVTWNDTFNLVSAERVGNNVYIYLNGTKIKTIDVTGATFYTSTAKLNIGAIDNLGTGSHWVGWINETRLVKGTGLYNGTSFTPPTKPFSFYNLVPNIDTTGAFETTAVDKITLEDAVSKRHTQDTDKDIVIDSTPDSDVTGEGIKSTFTAGENLSFGDICYFKSDGKMWKSDADASSTMPVIAMALGTISADASGSFLLLGVARDDSWNWTVGAILYADTATAGGMTETAPSGTADIVQAVGVAITADVVYFKPDLTTIEIA